MAGCSKALITFRALPLNMLTDLLHAQADLLPKGTDLGEVAAWLERAAEHKRLSPIVTFVVSSRTRESETRTSTWKKALSSDNAHTAA